MARINPEINAGSMADIAFLLLIFFLVTTTMDVDKGLLRMLPPPIDPNAPPPEPVNERNVFVVLVDQYDRVAHRGEVIDIKDLRKITKDHIQNLSNELKKPEEVFEDVEGIGNVRRTKYVISLKTDRTTTYEMYVAVQNELAAAINELRDEFSRARFGKAFADLTDQTIVDGITKRIWRMAISEAEPDDIGGQGSGQSQPNRRRR
jgi:biopolymer transport protein ExbD